MPQTDASSRELEQPAEPAEEWQPRSLRAAPVCMGLRVRVLTGEPGYFATVLKKEHVNET
jgi:hypothetical protein